MKLHRVLFIALAVALLIRLRPQADECECEACVPTLFAEVIDDMGFHNPTGRQA